MVRVVDKVLSLSLLPCAGFHGRGDGRLRSRRGPGIVEGVASQTSQVPQTMAFRSSVLGFRPLFGILWRSACSGFCKGSILQIRSNGAFGAGVAASCKVSWGSDLQPWLWNPVGTLPLLYTQEMRQFSRFLQLQMENKCKPWFAR